MAAEKVEGGSVAKAAAKEVAKEARVKAEARVMQAKVALAKEVEQKAPTPPATKTAAHGGSLDGLLLF
eukprot:4151604-Pleurochrysis_carterae.AAC.3